MTGALAMNRLLLRALAAFVLAGAVPAAALDSSRVVTVGGAVTEIVYALGFADRIVGVDTTSVYPPQALRERPNVGYMRALSAEGVLSLKPSAVIAVEGAGPPATLKQLDDAGAPLFSIRDTPTPEGAADKIESIGALFGARERAHAMAKSVRARFAALETMRPRVAKPPRVLFVLSLQNGRVLVGGRDTAADAAIRLAGGVNAAEGVSGFKPMTDEGVIAAAPDMILKMSNGGRVGDADELFTLPALAATPAAAKRALISMDGPYLLGFGPREPEALRDLMAALYPDLNLPPLPDAGKEP
jgi:iron complex transport system substrate-binding protein